MLWDSRGRGIPGCRTVGGIPVDCCRIKSGVDGGGGGGGAAYVWDRMGRCGPCTSRTRLLWDRREEGAYLCLACAGSQWSTPTFGTVGLMGQIDYVP